MSKLGMGFEAIEALDRELARLVRSTGALKYGLGAGLEALAKVGGHHELGFASVEAYALERCERSGRWVQEARLLARRLESLPAMRDALVQGRVSYCMAVELAKGATPETEKEWLARAATETVRQIREAIRAERVGSGGDACGDAVHALVAEEERATLTVTVAREDAWVFECARLVVGRLGGATREETVEALLGEGVTAVQDALRAGGQRHALTEFDDMGVREPQRAWETQLAAWRDEAERRCEAHVLACRNSESDDDLRRGIGCALRARSDDDTVAAIDAELRRLASELGRRDLALGEIAERFWRDDGWRRLGYATEAQYCRERLGCSLSSVKAKRALARRVRALPELRLAVERREIGYEGARLVASVATPTTAKAWIERARRRTVRHLREEVDAVAMLARLGGSDGVLPPTDETMKKVARVEAQVVSGAAFRGASDGQMSALLAELIGEPPDRADRSTRSHGRVTLRFDVGAGLARYYRWLEGEYHRRHVSRASFLRFTCEALIDSWKHVLESRVEYAAIYERDRFRCASPVCNRSDVTPHHLRFRAHGGDESNENLASLCTWCHLEGIHGGRLRAAPPASDIEWRLGRNTHTVVRGRERETRFTSVAGAGRRPDCSLLHCQSVFSGTRMSPTSPHDARLLRHGSTYGRLLVQAWAAIISRPCCRRTRHREEPQCEQYRSSESLS
jgi:hypothetical protein